MLRSKGSLALLVLCATQFMLIVDIVALNVALPSIQSGLDIASGQLQLTSVAYTLTFGSLLIVAGRAGDLLGRRRLFQAGLTVFTLASAMAAASPSAQWLFVARALQGIGAAMVSPTAFALMTSMFAEGQERNRALGIWAAVGSGGAIAGQILGGVLTELLGWRSIFLINVPVGVLAIIFARRLFPESHGSRERLDLQGAALLSATVVAFTLALARVAEDGLDAGVAVRTCIAAGLAMAFLHTERRHSAPLLKLSLFANRGVRTGNGVLALLAGGTAGALFFTTLYLQGVLGYSAMEVGFAFAPVVLIVLGVSPFAGRAASVIGVRRMLVAGTILTGAGLLLLARVDANGSYLTEVLPGLAIVALGNGLAFAPTMIAATSGVVDQDQGLAGGLLSTAQELGTAFGLAIVAPIAVLAADASDLATPDATAAAGYRAGFLAAAALVAIAVVIALRVPAGVGKQSNLAESREADPIAA
jgi:EmrB/QacA subfamily drug resistance transporter